MYQVVLDTCVLFAALRSRRGASWQLISSLGDERWRPNLTVAVVLEYEAVLKRECAGLRLTPEEIDAVIDATCSVSGLHRQYFSARPVLPDPDDELILEAAIASRSDFIVTFNGRDFSGSERFGVRCVTPGEFLILLRRQT